MKITPLEKQTMLLFTVLYFAIVLFVVLTIELYVKVSFWASFAYVLVQTQMFFNNQYVFQLKGNLAYQAAMFSNSIKMLSEAVTIQSRRITPIEEFLTSKVSERADLPIH